MNPETLVSNIKKTAAKTRIAFVEAVSILGGMGSSHAITH